MTEYVLESDIIYTEGDIANIEDDVTFIWNQGIMKSFHKHPQLMNKTIFSHKGPVLLE